MRSFGPKSAPIGARGLEVFIQTVGARLGYVEGDVVVFREDGHLLVDLGGYLGAFCDLLLRGVLAIACYSRGSILLLLAQPMNTVRRPPTMARQAAHQKKDSTALILVVPSTMSWPVCRE